MLIPIREENFKNFIKTHMIDICHLGRYLDRHDVCCLEIKNNNLSGKSEKTMSQ